MPVLGYSFQLNAPGMSLVEPRISGLLSAHSAGLSLRRHQVLSSVTAWYRPLMRSSGRRHSVLAAELREVGLTDMSLFGQLVAFARARLRTGASRLTLAGLTSFVGIAWAAPPTTAAATTVPVKLTFSGHTTSHSFFRQASFVYHFTVPYDHRFEVSWTSTPYPPNAHGKSQIFGIDVGAYGNPNNVPCDSPKIWCGPDKTPPSGSQTFYSYGSGTFAVGILADEEQWVITVEVTPDPGRVAPKPSAPGVGGTIKVPAIPGASGQYEVTLLQVFNTITWSAPRGDLKGTRPIDIKLRITDDGSQPVDLTPSTQGIYWAVGGSGFSLSSGGRTFTPTGLGNNFALTGCHQFGSGTPGTLLPGEAVVGCVVFAYSATRPLVGSELWLQSGWLSDGQNLGRLYHWALNGPPW